MAAICAATCEADPGRDKYPKSVAANDKTTIIYFYSIASKLFPGLCLSCLSIRLSVYLSASLSLACALPPHNHSLSLSLRFGYTPPSSAQWQFKPRTPRRPRTPATPQSSRCGRSRVVAAAPGTPRPQPLCRPDPDPATAPTRRAPCTHGRKGRPGREHRGCCGRRVQSVGARWEAGRLAVCLS